MATDYRASILVSDINMDFLNTLVVDYKYNLISIKRFYSNDENCGLANRSHLTFAEFLDTPYRMTESSRDHDLSKPKKGRQRHQDQDDLTVPSLQDTPQTACVKDNLSLVTSIAIEDCIENMHQKASGANNRSGFRGVRKVNSKIQS